MSKKENQSTVSPERLQRGLQKGYEIRRDVADLMDKHGDDPDVLIASVLYCIAGAAAVCDINEALFAQMAHRSYRAAVGDIMKTDISKIFHENPDILCPKKK